jgi:hypothetical protein
VPNFEKTRWFLVLRLRKPAGDGLNKLLKLCNNVVEDHGQPPLYAVPEVQNKPLDKKAKKGQGESLLGIGNQVQDFSDSFHISVGWSLVAPSTEVVEHVRTVTKDVVFKDVKGLFFEVKEIKVKVGNLVTSIRLPVKPIDKPNYFSL